MKAETKTHGGPNRGQGRKAADGVTNLLRKQVKVDPATIDTLAALGDGNLSLGIRKAAGVVRDGVSPVSSGPYDLDALVYQLMDEIAANLPQRSVPKMRRTVEAAVKNVMRVVVDQGLDFNKGKLKEDRARMKEVVSDAKKEKATYERLNANIKQIISKNEFKLIRSSLHPDKHLGEEKYQKAFEAFNRLAGKFSE